MYGILVFDWGEFRAATLDVFARLNEKRIALKVITGYGYDNAHYCFEDICGNLYRFSLDRLDYARDSIMDKGAKQKFGDKYRFGDPVYSLHVWDGRGQQTIFMEQFLGDRYEWWKKTIPEEVIKRLDEAIRRYKNGSVSCSDCKEWTNANAGRQYFAGTYCEGCWEGTTGQHKGMGGWRYIESKETYD